MNIDTKENVKRRVSSAVLGFFAAPAGIGVIMLTALMLAALGLHRPAGVVAAVSIPLGFLLTGILCAIPQQFKSLHGTLIGVWISILLPLLFDPQTDYGMVGFALIAACVSVPAGFAIVRVLSRSERPQLKGPRLQIPGLRGRHHQKS